MKKIALFHPWIKSKGGAEKVVLACTDLGNVLKEDPRLIDSTEILIEKIKQKSI